MSAAARQRIGCAFHNWELAFNLRQQSDSLSIDRRLESARHHARPVRTMKPNSDRLSDKFHQVAIRL